MLACFWCHMTTHKKASRYAASVVYIHLDHGCIAHWKTHVNPHEPSCQPPKALTCHLAWSCILSHHCAVFVCLPCAHHQCFNSYLGFTPKSSPIRIPARPILRIADHRRHQLLWALLLDTPATGQADPDTEGRWHGAGCLHVLDI